MKMCELGDHHFIDPLRISAAIINSSVILLLPFHVGMEKIILIPYITSTIVFLSLLILILHPDKRLDFHFSTLPVLLTHGLTYAKFH